MSGAAFRYALEALLQRQRWRLDRDMRDLAAARREQAEADTALARLLEQQRLALEAGRTSSARLDPLHARARLSHLCRLADQATQVAASRDAISTRCDELRRQCIASQARLDALERHRERCHIDHGREQFRLAQISADEQWTAHRQHGGHDTT